MRLTNITRKPAEIERVASKDKARPVLTHVYLNAEKGRLEAANSYAAAMIPCAVEEGDESGLIPAEALKAQRKASRYSAAPLSVNGDVRLSTSEGEQSWKKGEGQWPDFDKLVPEEFSGFRVSLNPKLLLELAQALGDPEKVVIEFALQGDKTEGEGIGFFPNNMRPMRVTVPSGTEESYGILMPILMPIRIP